MNAIPFDTLKLAHRLEQAGFTKEQAAGTASALAEATSQEMATKTDIARLEASTKADIARLETHLETGLMSLEQRMTIKLGAMIAAGVAFLTAIKFFGH